MRYTAILGHVWIRTITVSRSPCARRQRRWVYHGYGAAQRIRRTFGKTRSFNRVCTYTYGLSSFFMADITRLSVADFAARAIKSKRLRKYFIVTSSAASTPLPPTPLFTEKNRVSAGWTLPIPLGCTSTWHCNGYFPTPPTPFVLFTAKILSAPHTLNILTPSRPSVNTHSERCCRTRLQVHWKPF